MVRQKSAAVPPPTSVAEPPKSKSYQLANHAFILLAIVVLWIYHFRHLSTLFENDRQFSHLADFEREMTYRTEMVCPMAYSIQKSQTFRGFIIHITKQS